MKKFIYVLVFVLLFGGGFFAIQNMPSNAKQVEFQVETANETIEKGNDVTVTFSVKGDTQIKAVEAYIYYEDSVVEFVSADSSAITGTSGVLKLSQQFEEGTSEAVYALDFHALEVGTTTFKVQEMHVEEWENEEVTTVDNSTAKITVTKNDEESKNANLESLEVFPDTLTPAFEPDVYEYSMTVESDITDIVISAIPSDGESIVQVDGNEELKVGSNRVVITVTSVSGVKKEYQIRVNKQ